MIKLRVNPSRVFIFTAIAALTIIYAALWLQMISSPSERTGADFIAFYTAGRIAQQQGVEHVYNQGLQQQIEAREVGFALLPGQVLLYNHMPFLTPLLSVLFDNNYVGSFVRWCILLLALLLAANGILGGLLRQRGFDTQSILFAMAGSSLFFQGFYSILNGQDTAFLMLGAASLMVGILNKKDTLAGLGLSVMLVRPHIALALAIPFLFQRRKVFLYFMLGAILLAFISVLILGGRGVLEFINILSISAKGEWYGMNEAGMYNLIGLFFRIFPIRSSTIRIFGWIAYFGGILTLCFLWKKYPMDAKMIGLSILLALFTAPHLHFHDLELLLIPIFCILLMNFQPGSQQKIALLPMILSVVLFTSVTLPFLEYSLPYLVMLFLLVYLLFPQAINNLVFRK